MDTGRRQETRSTNQCPPPEASPLLAAPSQSQFSTAAGSPPAVKPPGSSTLVAVPVDPCVIHCRWELAAEDLEKTKKNLAVDNDEFWPALQFFDVTANRTPGSPSFSVDVQLAAGNWFVRCASAEHTYRADLVIRNENGSFAVIASSDSVRTPPAATSADVDLDWMPIRLLPTEPKTVPPTPVSAQRAQEAFEGPGAVIEMPVPVHIEVVKEFPSDQSTPHADVQPEPPARAAAPPSHLPTNQRSEAAEPFQLHRETREIVQPVPAENPLHRPATCERRTEPALPKPRTFETKKGTVGDLTELNESSFLSGISSARN